MTGAAGRRARLGILLSGRGSNFLAIADAIEQNRLAQAEIAIVVSNRADAPGIEAARRRGLKTAVLEARGRKRARNTTRRSSPVLRNTRRI